MAEAVFRAVSSSPSSPFTFRIDSAGIGIPASPADGGDGGGHNAPPDPHVLSTLAAHGITGFTHAARGVRAEDFTAFDYVLALDDESLEEVLEVLERLREEQEQEQEHEGGAQEPSAQVWLFGDFAEAGESDGGGCKVHEVGGGPGVPDPYFDNGEDNFEIAYQLVERFSRGFLRYLECEGKSQVGDNS